MIKKLIPIQFFIIITPHLRAMTIQECKIDLANHTELINQGKSTLRSFLLEKPSSQPFTTSQYPSRVLIPLSLRTQEQARLMIWALYDMAAHDKKIYFTEGTFVIADPGARLFNFFRNIPESYKRMSSHFKSDKFQHYGLDIEGLPCGKHHILFGQLSNGKMFLKPENYGLGSITDSIEHAKEYIIAQVRKIESLRNLFGMVSDTAPEFKKERIDSNLLKEFKNILEQVEPDQGTINHHMRSAQGYGIQKIITILKTYINDYKPLQHVLETPPPDLSQSWVAVDKKDIDQSRELLDKIVDFLEKIAENDHVYERTGNEIIVSRNDLQRFLMPYVVQKESEID